MNMSISTTPTAGTVRKRFSQAAHPSELFLFVDSKIGDDTWWISFATGAEEYKNIGFHHNGNTGFNAVYFDGHVKYLPLNHTPLTATDPPLTLDNFE